MDNLATSALWNPCMQSPIALVEDALRVHANSLKRRGVRIVRRFDAVPVTPLDKHKVLQILVRWETLRLCRRTPEV